MQIFEYAILLQPKLDKDGDETEPGQILVPVTHVLATDQHKATVIASRAIPDDAMDRLDRVELVVRPF